LRPEYAKGDESKKNYAPRASRRRSSDALLAFSRPTSASSASPSFASITETVASFDATGLPSLRTRSIFWYGMPSRIAFAMMDLTFASNWSASSSHLSRFNGEAARIASSSRASKVAAGAFAVAVILTFSTSRTECPRFENGSRVNPCASTC